MIDDLTVNDFDKQQETFEVPRDIFLADTRALDPVTKKPCSARVVERDGEIFLEKSLHSGQKQSVLVERDASFYRRFAQLAILLKKSAIGSKRFPGADYHDLSFLSWKKYRLKPLQVFFFGIEEPWKPHEKTSTSRYRLSQRLLMGL